MLLLLSQLLERHDEHIVDNGELQIHVAGRSLWPVNALPDAVIGMRGHALEVARRERRNDANDVVESEAQCRTSGERRDGGPDPTRRDHGFDDRQTVLRRSLLHTAMLT